jgi:nitrate/TMAO reductase-like tetraheme cytochrome c subunit
MSTFRTKLKQHRPAVLAVVLGLGLLGFALGIAQPVGAASTTAPGQIEPSANSDCLYCHGKEGMSMTLPSGEVSSLTIDPGHFAGSIHNGLACTDCHTGISGYPHPKFDQQTQRDITMKWYTSCQKCHAEQYNKTLDSVHQRALAGGNTNAAVCTDCHNPHTQTRLTDPGTGELLPDARVQIPQTCARCHSVIYDTYKQSVHGSALTGQGNQEVPTCIDCHGVHNIQDPTTASFRLDSPEMCGKCHTNATLMSKYGIPINVLNTYVADFHGTTVTLFEKTSPDQATNKPVCFDCHGVHNIKKVDDPVYGLEMKANLLTACQRCHPDATANFPDAWMSHYIPSPTHYPIVYYVNLFYKIFIPTVIGGMAIYVVSDIVRRLIERRRGAKHA